MGRIWIWSVILSLAAALATGRAEEMATSMFAAGGEAVSLVLTLTASMTLWSGLLEILSATGDLGRLGRLTGRMAAPLFGGVRDEACWEAMGTNLTANILGLGNAATPAGILAAQRLSQLGEPGLRALGVLLVLNNAGLQLIPSTVMALRQAAGSADPGSIVLPSMAASVASAVVGVIVLRMMQGRGRRS